VGVFPGSEKVTASVTGVHWIMLKQQSYFGNWTMTLKCEAFVGAQGLGTLEQSAVFQKFNDFTPAFLPDSSE
jgi:hypothetical protein